MTRNRQNRDFYVASTSSQTKNRGFVPIGLRRSEYVGLKKARRSIPRITKNATSAHSREEVLALLVVPIHERRIFLLQAHR